MPFQDTEFQPGWQDMGLWIHEFVLPEHEPPYYISIVKFEEAGVSTESIVDGC